MFSNSIINRIKKVFEKENLKKKELRKRKLGFEQLENKEMLTSMKKIVF